MLTTAFVIVIQDVDHVCGISIYAVYDTHSDGEIGFCFLSIVISTYYLIIILFCASCQ